MIHYICKACNSLSCESSICPVCGKRAELVSSEIFYCVQCDSPSYFDVCPRCGNKCKKLSSDIRPVFAQERLLIEVLLNKPMAFAGKQMWALGQSNFFVDGTRFHIGSEQIKSQKLSDIFTSLEKYSSENTNFCDDDLTNESVLRFIEVNSNRLNLISSEACDYIRNVSHGFDNASMFVSFSGGKDSTVVSNLVMRALGTESIIHIYGDTTLEYPLSSAYLQEFKHNHTHTPVLVAKNSEQNFTDLCNLIGPPSRVMRWCCTIFKTGPIAQKIEQVFGDKKRILSFQGVRRAESVSRSKYERDTDSPKITRQKVAAPIIDWLDFDVWLYILGNRVPFNSAYRQGFSRVGCWCCPNNSDRSEFLSSVYMPDEFTKFKNLLYMFAKTVGKEDWKNYVDSGKWKARQGGNGLDYSKLTNVEFKPCALDENSINFELTKPIEYRLYTLFKPFGILNFELGNKRLGEVYILDRASKLPLFKISGRPGTSRLKVTFLNSNTRIKNRKIAETFVRNQITKYQICLGCLYCQSVCRFGALKVSKTATGKIEYSIDESKCVSCLECVKHFDGGCYLKKVLRVKKGEQ